MSHIVEHGPVVKAQLAALLSANVIDRMQAASNLLSYFKLHRKDLYVISDLVAKHDRGECYLWDDCAHDGIIQTIRLPDNCFISKEQAERERKAFETAKSVAVFSGKKFTFANDRLAVRLLPDPDTVYFTDRKELFGPIIPGARASALTGPPAAGKSRLASNCAAHMALGLDWLGFKLTSEYPTGIRTGFLFCEASEEGPKKLDDAVYKASLRVSYPGITTPEDRAQFIMSRRPVVLSEAAKFFFVEMERNSNAGIYGTTLYRELRDAIEGSPADCPLKLVFIDTFSSFLSANGNFDQNSAHDMSKVMTTLELLSRELDVAIVLIDHLNKQGVYYGAVQKLAGVSAMLEATPAERMVPGTKQTVSLGYSVLKIAKENDSKTLNDTFYRIAAEEDRVIKKPFVASDVGDLLVYIEPVSSEEVEAINKAFDNDKDAAKAKKAEDKERAKEQKRLESEDWAAGNKLVSALVCKAFRATLSDKPDTPTPADPLIREIYETERELSELRDFFGVAKLVDQWAEGAKFQNFVDAPLFFELIDGKLHVTLLQSDVSRAERKVAGKKTVANKKILARTALIKLVRESGDALLIDEIAEKISTISPLLNKKDFLTAWNTLLEAKDFPPQLIIKTEGPHVLYWED